MLEPLGMWGLVFSSLSAASMNIAATAGIIGGVLAGVVVLAIIIYCCRRRAKRQKDAEG